MNGGYAGCDCTTSCAECLLSNSLFDNELKSVLPHPKIFDDKDLPGCEKAGAA